MIMCDKKYFVKSLNKYKLCIREGSHGGRCTPDLEGERFGSLVVVGIGKSRTKKHKNRVKTYYTWTVNQCGVLRDVQAADLVSGKIVGLQNVGTGFVSKKNKLRPEYSTISTHYHWIFKQKVKGYKGMPFYDDWNPSKGGAFWKGAKWIIENLGERPIGKWSLDIISHRKGFVPGNLRWAKKGLQNFNKMYKILGRFSLQELKVEAKRHGYILIKENKND